MEKSLKKVIGTEKALEKWFKQLQGQIAGHPLLEFVQTRLRADIRVFDDCYGENRNLETELGGYMVILYGSSKEIKTEYKEILKYHNLKEQDYEYMDNQRLNDFLTVSIRLFLCSSDYAVEIVIIKEDGGNQNE